MAKEKDDPLIPFRRDGKIFHMLDGRSRRDPNLTQIPLSQAKFSDCLKFERIITFRERTSRFLLRRTNGATVELMENTFSNLVDRFGMAGQWFPFLPFSFKRNSYFHCVLDGKFEDFPKMEIGQTVASVLEHVPEGLRLVEEISLSIDHSLSEGKIL